MTRHDDAFQIWKQSFTRQTTDDLVHEVERSKFVIANLTATGAPAVGALCFADPICFVGSDGIATITDLISRRIAIGRKARRNDEAVM